MSLTLFINKSDAHCECCYLRVHHGLTNCPHCGGTWTHISSDYVGFERVVASMRPDLEPNFVFMGWHESEEGRKVMEEFKADMAREDGDS